MRLLKRSLAAAAVSAVVVGLASAAYQTWGSARDRRRFSPPGQLVDIGGRRIHLWVEGEGTPAVVLVPALGEPCLDFAHILPDLASETTTVVFDRAGLGWSDPVWSPMAHVDAAADLHLALQAAGIEPPYILAGHSLGGWILRLFAAAYPVEVAGLVFIDASHPDQANHIRGYRWRTLTNSMKRRSKWYGVRRLLMDSGLAEPPSYDVPAEFADAMVALEFGDRQRRTSWWELALRGPIGAAVSRRTGTLGDIPVTVLTCSEDNPDATTEKQRAYARWHFGVWYPLQADLAALSTDSKHVVAEQAGHYIHHHQPELVVEAILDLVQRVRT